MRRNGADIGDKILNDRQRRLLQAATRQLEQAMLLGQNCQVVFNIASDGQTIKAKITLDIDLNNAAAG